jgi:hypothetical protein
MKRILIILALIIQTISTAFSQQAEKDFFVHDGRNIFYLMMPVSEVYEILGNPDKVQIIKNTVPFHDYNTVILEYSGIAFVYNDFFDNPEILIISFEDNYQSGNMNVIGRGRDEILEEYGAPASMEIQNGNIIFRYRFLLSPIVRITLQLRFNASGICVGAMLIHSNISI